MVGCIFIALLVSYCLPGKKIAHISTRPMFWGIIYAFITNSEVKVAFRMKSLILGLVFHYNRDVCFSNVNKYILIAMIHLRHPSLVLWLSPSVSHLKTDGSLTTRHFTAELSSFLLHLAKWSD